MDTGLPAAQGRALKKTRAAMRPGWPGGFCCFELLLALPLGALIFAVIYNDISKYRAEQRELSQQVPHPPNSNAEYAE